MGIMAQPFKHPSTGVYYFRRGVPKDIREVIGSREWKVSLKTKDPSSARPRFAAESLKCEEAFLAARDQLAGKVRLLTSDAPKLADRWAKAVLASWESGEEDFTAFLVAEGVDETDGYDYSPACDIVNSDELKDRAANIQPLMNAFLREQQKPLPNQADPAYTALVDCFFGRWCDLRHLAYRRQTGDWRSRLDITEAEQPLSHEASSTGTPKLSEVHQRWAESKRLGSPNDPKLGKTLAEYAAIVSRFIELHGDLPVDRITRAIVLDFRALLSKIPSSGSGLRGLTAPQQIAKAEAERLPTLSLGTVKKNLRAVSTVLGYAKKQLGAIQEDPIAATGVITVIGKAINRADKGEEKGYSWSELLTVFTSPIYTQGWQPARADYGKAFYWLPLLMAYTGARREELCQLTVSDVGQDEGSSIWYLHIRPGEGQSVKTASSRRKVPLHSDLIALDFIDYKNSLPASGRLFPDLTHHPADGWGHNFGKLWAKYLRNEAGVNSSANPAHGFRHSFKTLCREVGIPGEVHDWLTGHSIPGVGATYGSTPLRRMAEELEKFPRIAVEAGLLKR